MARKIFTTILGLGLIGFTWFFTTKDLDSETASTQHFLNAQALLDLEPFGDWDLEKHFNKDLSIIFYFSELSCRTCTNQELQTVARWHEQYADHVNFYLVVQGQETSYLHNLKRLGKVRYPLLIEASRGQLGLGDTTIALFRKDTDQILAHYFPNPDQSHLAEKASFERRLHKEMGDLVSNGARTEATYQPRSLTGS